MSHEINFDDDDEGKEVADSNGETVGRIVTVEHGTAHVDPDPGITEKVKSSLGWGDKDEDTYPLQETNVESVDDDKIYLKHL
jgi:hypothetical protein